MNTEEIIQAASHHLKALPGHEFNVLDVTKPVSPASAVNLAKVISKLSPLLGNLIEFNTVELLNEREEFKGLGRWVRQDPGFPDTIFQGSVQPVPGFEIKAWFPLATEVTARFKDSQNHFVNGNTYVVLLAWLPEFVIYGKPRIVGVTVMEGGSVAHARDTHYHNPPDYLVLEPEDTKKRTRNLQQTNTNGFKWQGEDEEFVEARKLVETWGEAGRTYKPTPEYQALLHQLRGRFKYRGDTNYAKIDRIVHPEIERFKKEIYKLPFQGLTIGQWNKTCASKNTVVIARAFTQYLGIKEADADVLVR